MNTNTLLALVSLIALPAVAHAADTAPTSASIRHRMIMILEFPAKSGREAVRFPVTFAARGQTVEYSHREQSVTMSFTVGEISAGQIDLNYTVSSRSSDDPLAPYMLRSYTEFDLSAGSVTKSITVDGKPTISITLEKEK